MSNASVSLVVSSRFSSGQRGVTLIELMIGLTVGALILAGAVTLFAKISFSGLENTRSMRLNQQLRESMDFIRRDLQRAGYVLSWPAAPPTGTAADLLVDAIGDFGKVTIGATELTSLPTYVGAAESSNCILYSYDFTDAAGTGSSDGVLDSGDLFGVRLNDGAVETSVGLSSCDDNPAWKDISDPSVTVTALTFELDPDDSVVWVVEEGGVVEADCGAGDTCFARRKINVVLEGQLVSDAAVTVRLRDEVKIKNDHYYTRP